MKLAHIMLVIFALSLAWGQDVPFYQRATQADQDIGAVNQNFRALSTKGKDVVGGAEAPGDSCTDAPTFCVDATNHRVGIGTSVPTAGLHVTAASTISGAITSSGANSFSGANTFTGGVNISSVNVTEASPTTPLTNRIYQDSIVKAWIKFVGDVNPPTISDSFNVSSITDGGAGVFDLNFATSFANTNYVAVGNMGSPGAPALAVMILASFSTGSFSMRTRNLAGNNADFDLNTVVLIGDQ